jgi:hypothetical protein
MRRLLAVALLSVSAALAACSNDVNEPEDVALFTVQVSGEQFKVKAEGASAIAALEARRLSGQVGVISGILVRGNGGFNSTWGWHLEPATVTAPDLAIELCDGRPSMVQADLDYWVDTVKQFCPWGAKVSARN